MGLNAKDSARVREHLKNILSHDLFASANRLKCFLEYICEKKLAGKENEIKEYSIAVEAFNLSSAFDQQLNPRVRVEAMRLRKRLNEYYKIFGDKSDVCIKIPKGSYVPRFDFIDRPFDAVQVKDSQTKAAFLTGEEGPDKDNIKLSNIFLTLFERDISETGNDGVIWMRELYRNELLFGLSGGDKSAGKNGAKNAAFELLTDFVRVEQTTLLYATCRKSDDDCLLWTVKEKLDSADARGKIISKIGKFAGRVSGRILRMDKECGNA